MVPIPVTRPAPGASSRYMPLAASALNSRKAVPGSSNAPIRSRTNILPRDVCRFRASSPPPCCTISCFLRSSATSSSMASRLACVSALANVPPNVVDDVFGRYSWLEHFAHSKLLEFGNVLIGNDSTNQNEYVIEFFLLHELHDPGTERHVSSGQDRKPNHVHVLLQRSAHHLLRCLSQSGVDHFEACVTKSSRNDFCAAIVSVETRLCNEHAN